VRVTRGLGENASLPLVVAKSEVAGVHPSTMKGSKRSSAMSLRLLDKRWFVLGLLVMNAVTGIFIFRFPESYVDFGPPFLGFGLFAFLAAMWFCRGNLLFQSRLLLLVTIGYYAGLIKAVDSSAAFSPIGIEAQTLEVGAKMFALTSLALLGAFVGLVWGFRPLREPGYAWAGTAASMSFPLGHFSLATVIVLITGYFSARSYGDSIFQASYASGSGKGQVLGNLQAIGVIAMVLAITAGSRLKTRWTTPLLIFLGGYFFVWGILIRGGRTEVLSGILAVVISSAAATGRVASLKPRHYVAALVLALFMEAWGTIRGTVASAEASEETIIDGYRRLQAMGIYHAGTISAIATTFSNTIHMVDHNVVPFDLGKSYSDYLLRTPPAFVYPDRPRDLAWMFPDFGYAAVGGMFELAEAFFNFGLLGCVAVPFCVSFVIGRTYRNAMGGRLFWLFVFAALLAETFRGAWYQTFAYYKGAVTGVILYCAFVLLADRFPRLRVSGSISPSATRA
jgi:hypothetical protein